jgi:hypothetical protein
MATESRTPLLSPHGMIDGDRGSRDIWIIDAIADPDADFVDSKTLTKEKFRFSKRYFIMCISWHISWVIYLSFVILHMNLMWQTETRRHPGRNSTQGPDVLDDLQKTKIPFWELPVQSERK